MFEAIFALLSSCLDAPQPDEGFPRTVGELVVRH
jgi:hypothetical protein